MEGKEIAVTPMEGKLETSIKITNTLTSNSAISLLEIYPADIFAHMRNDVFKIVILVLTMAKDWKQANVQ